MTRSTTNVCCTVTLCFVLCGRLDGIAASAGDVDLLVSSTDTENVLRYDGLTGAFIDVFAEGNGLARPFGLALGPDENLYVASAGTSSVLRFNGETGEFIDVFVNAGSGGLDSIRGIAFGPDDHLYVSSFMTNEVLRYDGQTGTLIDEFVTAGSGGLYRPTDVSFGPDDNLYVACYSANGIVNRYDGQTGAFIDNFTQYDPFNELSFPRGMDWGRGGRLYVGSLSERTLWYDGQTGECLGVFASGGGLDLPQGVLFGPDGNLYVSSQGTNEVIQYDGTTGEFLSVFAHEGMMLPTYLLFVARCRADVNGDGEVDEGDLLRLLAAWGTPGASTEDINGDGIVDVQDLLLLLAAWGPCP